MVNAQEWLDRNYPKKERGGIIKLDISNENLEGGLDLSDFMNLEELNCLNNQLTNLNNCRQLRNINCGFNKLTSLDLTNLTKLETLECNDNLLTNFDYSSLNPGKLISLNVSDNNLPNQDLSVFSRFTNLELLLIGSENEEHFKKNIYNKFTGSLEPLKNLEKLKFLYIPNTDIDSGLEHLPKSLEEIYCSSKERLNSKVKDLEEQLKINFFFDFEDDRYVRNWKNIHPDFTSELKDEWEDEGFNYNQCQEWINIGINPQDNLYCAWLRNSKKIIPNERLVADNKQQLRLKKEYNDFSIMTQQWLEENYPNKEIGEIYINCQLEGELDLRDYIYLAEVSISLKVDKDKFTIKKGFYKDLLDGGEFKEPDVVQCIQVQEYLQNEYPTKKQRKKVKNLDISNKNLEGELDLSDFSNLEELECFNNKLTSLDVSKCIKLKRIICPYNQLTALDCDNLNQLKELICSGNYLAQIIYSTNPKQLTKLHVTDNNLSEQDLTIFNQFINLEHLYINNNNKRENVYNRFYGSLEPLKDLKKLNHLDVSNTNVSGSLEPLKDLNNLWKLDISNTDLNSGWEYLPNSLEWVYYRTEDRSTCKLAEVEELWDKITWKDIHEDFAPRWKKSWLAQGFDKRQTKEFFLKEWSKIEIEPKDATFINWFLNFKKLDLTWALENEEEFKYLKEEYSSFGTCSECQQPNTNSKWCQSCNAKHFQAEFSHWTSGNPAVDEFIQKCQLEAISPWDILEWIPYDRFRDIEYLAEGGFGRVEKAIWMGGAIANWENEDKKWKRYGDWDKWDEENLENKYKNYKTVVLKTLTNSKSLNTEFLPELTSYKIFRSEVSNIVPCYGISRDLESNYIIIMEFMNKGNLKQYLKKNHQKLSLVGDILHMRRSKLFLLKQITQGLKDIHRKNLIHRDFHSGNIITDEEEDGGFYKTVCRITDLGLSKPVNEEETKDKIYGVMPYIAPEVLRNQPYTQKSDIYSLGMVMYEVTTGLPPFFSESHDTNLALQICRGIRPQFPKQIKYPQLLVDLIAKCWDQDPNNRPTAREISEIVKEWFNELWDGLKEGDKFCLQCEEADEHNWISADEIKYPAYQAQEVWHSKPINTKRITELLQLQSDCLDCQIPSNEISRSTGLTKQFKRQLSFSDETQRESKSVKLSELVAEPMEINNIQSENWQTFFPVFTSKLTQSWQNHNFTFQQTQDWLNIGLQPTDFNFATWLRDTKHFTPEAVLNYGNLEQLQQEFFNWQEKQQAQIEALPK